MANPMKGEALVRVSTGEFTLAMTFGAVAAIEADFGKPIGEVLAGMEATQSIADMMRVIHAALRKHHGMTLDEVGDIIMLAEAAVWGEALGRAISDPGDRPEGKAARPPKAKA